MRGITWIGGHAADWAGHYGGRAEAPWEWFQRELNFAADASEMTDDLVAEVDAILGPRAASPTDDQYRRAAQLIACRRGTCGGPDAGHDHIA